jgi:hypothetical protein
LTQFALRASRAVASDGGVSPIVLNLVRHEFPVSPVRKGSVPWYTSAESPMSTLPAFPIVALPQAVCRLVLNNLKRELVTCFTDSTANGRIL